MKVSDLYHNEDVYDVLEESVLDSIKRFVKSGLMKVQTVNVVVSDVTITILKAALKGIDGVSVTQDKGKVKVAVTVEKEAQFKTILNKIRNTDGKIVSVTK